MNRTVPMEAKPRLKSWSFCMLLVISVLSVVTGAGFGRQGIEKMLTALVMPVGFFWLVVTTWMILAWKQNRTEHRWWATGSWILLTLLSTGPLPNYWTNYLESQVPLYRPENEQPLDYLVVLGGGTSSGPTRSQLGGSGDRVVYAAQLFLQKHCQHLITTGSAANLLGKQAEMGPTEQTIEIWTSLGIPRSAITPLAGKNTYEEMQNLKTLLPDFEDKRVGLLTSASHLPRAHRLAKAAGVHGLISIPANHSGGDFARSIGYYLPSAQHLNKFANCQHEWMGSLIGR